MPAFEVLVVLEAEDVEPASEFEVSDVSEADGVELDVLDASSPPVFANTDDSSTATTITTMAIIAAVEPFLLRARLFFAALRLLESLGAAPLEP